MFDLKYRRNARAEIIKTPRPPKSRPALAGGAAAAAVTALALLVSCAQSPAVPRRNAVSGVSLTRCDAGTVKSGGKQEILSRVSGSYQKKFRSISFTNEWVGPFGSIVLFGSLKSDPRQGVAVVLDPAGGQAAKYRTPSRHGPIRALKLMGSTSAVQVTAADGHVWVFSLFVPGFAEKTSGGVYAGKWTQLDRLRYVEGAVVSVRKLKDSTAVLRLKIRVNYHSATDPIDVPGSPYAIGSEQNFVLQKLPALRLSKGEDVVVYECGVYPLSGSTDRFAGAAVRYYQKGGGYYGLNGRRAKMPPEDYPDFQKVFW